MGQTRGACICLAVAQKYLAFHTAPPGTLASLGQNFMKNRRRESRRTVEGGGMVEVMQRKRERAGEATRGDRKVIM